MEITESALPVLVIDNNEIDIFISTKILEEIGITEITTIKSVTEALLHLSSTTTKYQLILVELNLPFKNGFDFINELNLKIPQGKIILISAFFSPVDVEKITFLELNFILKPIHNYQLKTVLNI